MDRNKHLRVQVGLDLGEHLALEEVFRQLGWDESRREPEEERREESRKEEALSGRKLESEHGGFQNMTDFIELR